MYSTTLVHDVATAWVRAHPTCSNRVMVCRDVGEDSGSQRVVGVCDVSGRRQRTGSEVDQCLRTGEKSGRAHCFEHARHVVRVAEVAGVDARSGGRIS